MSCCFRARFVIVREWKILCVYLSTCGVSYFSSSSMMMITSPLTVPRKNRQKWTHYMFFRMGMLALVFLQLSYSFVHALCEFEWDRERSLSLTWERPFAPSLSYTYTLDTSDTTLMILFVCVTFRVVFACVADCHKIKFYVFYRRKKGKSK